MSKRLNLNTHLPQSFYSIAVGDHFKYRNKVYVKVSKSLHDNAQRVRKGNRVFSLSTFQSLTKVGKVHSAFI